MITAGQWQWMHFIEILDDRRRLRQDFAVVEHERRHPALRIDCAVFRAVLLAAVLGQMNEDLLGRDALEVERNANAKRGRRAEVSVVLHGIPRHAAIWNLEINIGVCPYFTFAHQEAAFCLSVFEGWACPGADRRQALMKAECSSFLATELPQRLHL